MPPGAEQQQEELVEIRDGGGERGQQLDRGKNGEDRDAERLRAARVFKIQEFRDLQFRQFI